LVAVSALGLQQAAGSPLLVEFSGKITGTQVDYGYWGYNPLDPSVTEGADFYGSLTYDPVGAVDTNPDPYHGSYYMGTAILGTVGTVSVAAYEMSLYVSNYRTYDQLSFWASNPDGGLPGLPITHLIVSLSGPETLFEDDSIPLTLDLEEFTYPSFGAEHYVDGDPPIGTLGVAGMINTLTVTPEPGTLGLLLVGVGLGSKRRHWVPLSVARER